MLREASVPVVVLVRHRPGGFVYTGGEIAALAASCREFASLGVSGIATGALDRFSRIDEGAVSALVDAAGDVPVTFHRAFDSVQDMPEALETLVDLGVGRVLTSGGAPTAPSGAGVIAGLVEQARGRIEVLPGGGVRSDNAALLARISGCGWIHGSFSRPAPGSAEPVFDPSEFGRVAGALGRSVQTPGIER